MRRNTGVSTRAAALDLLDAVLIRQARLDQALQQSEKFKRLESSDRAFARLIVSTCLRNLGEIDQAIDSFLNKPIAEKSLYVRHALRIAATQLMYLETPPHAAVDTGVFLVKGSRFAGFAGLVNAVLRRIATYERPPREEAAVTNIPSWLFQTWEKEYGTETARKIALAHTVEPPLDITAKSETGQIAADLGGYVLPTGSIRIKSVGDVTSLPRYDEGIWWVQDAAAALPARLIPKPAGKNILDLCAAPGGKAAQLVAAGGRVTAVDQSQTRLQLVRVNLARLNLKADIVASDVTNWRPPELADAVLLDAPCTATGTIRRHPDVAYLKQFVDVRRLARTQSALIEAAAEMVKPGGHLVYAVCSLQPEEGPRVINKFLLNNTAFSRDPIAPDELPGIADFVTSAGDLRTLPSTWSQEGGLDGFYAARLVRKFETR